MVKLQKVFDCQDMPKDIRTYFFDNYGEGKSNDVYITVYIEGSCDINVCKNDYKCWSCTFRKYNIVEQWLLDNGATEKDDSVIVKRWW